MSRRVVVVGSANVDFVWHGARFPAPGETVTDGEFVQVLGGKGTNQAAAAAALGADVRFIGCVGDDAHGRAARADLEARGIDCASVRTVDAPTGVALILVNAAGENVVAVAPGANRSLTRDAVDAIEPDDVVLCSCEIPLAVVRAAVARATTAIVNPAPAREIIADALLTPNQTECSRLGGVDALLAVAPAVIETRGAAGAILHRAHHEPVMQQAFACDAVDTTGAGDTFNGALAWALADGRSLEDALRLACAAGALATRALGARAALPTGAEVYALAGA